ncbi:hypothetical protein [Sporolactobacillus putidus]|uniref:Uncharacterized protein n=1 Tax=Sporolactobacillus putidus TaxID=492735 RepID=A0A917RZY7_9BACL|nr:hypothetical protein [Sporolactobacillus putidus]GGL47834.1 hypothetical protein GCM10007968_09990 [Sporolactobacillus putidus]
MDKNNEFREIISQLSEKEKKSLMDSSPEEVAKKWEEMYEIPIKQSKFFLNNIFFKQSGKTNDNDHKEK